ncbi:hypothetical protein DJ524_02260 [Sulfolobus sp. D5]|nr:hypothetical protein DJ524_02260 [Sulfolobus sp. D5]
MYTISFLRPIPLYIINKIFNTNDLEFNLKETRVSLLTDERNESFLKQISFFNGDVQYWADSFLSSLERAFKIRLGDVVWAYEAYVEVDKKVKLNLNLANVLPLLGNVINYGIIVSNDPDMKMRVRNFTTIQIDRTIKVIRRSENYFKIQNILDELEKVIKLFE